MRHNHLKAMLIALATYHSACGGGRAPSMGSPEETPRKQDKEEASADAWTPGANCQSKEDCPRANMAAVPERPLEENKFVAYRSEENLWTVTGFDKDFNRPARNIGVIVTDYPPGARVSPDFASGAKVEKRLSIRYSPMELVKSMVPMKVILRDLDRCRAREVDPEVCDKPASLPEYEESAEFDWQVRERKDDDVSGQPSSHSADAPQSPSLR